MIVALITPIDWAIAVRDAAIWMIILGILFIGAVLYAVVNIRRFSPVHGNDEFQKSRAIVTEDLDPEGLVMVQGEIWRASSTGGEVISRGQKVRVVGRDGMYLMVEPLSKRNSENDGRQDR